MRLISDSPVTFLTILNHGLEVASGMLPKKLKTLKIVAVVAYLLGILDEDPWPGSADQ